MGSVVVFENGTPLREAYRKYKIKTVEGPNDVASLQEVIRRRHARIKKEGGRLPDLILVDGGKGQLNAARLALKGLDLTDIPLISIAKREETVFIPGFKQGVKLDPTSPAIKLIQNIRDEAHRFAITFHRRERQKKSFSSSLDGIPGIGPKKKAALLERYRNIEKIRGAPLQELTALIGKRAAENLRRHFEE